MYYNYHSLQINLNLFSNSQYLRIIENFRIGTMIQNFIKFSYKFRSVKNPKN